ncbi:MAG: prepilin-type N-terminal cleavage/methylation domain-containing protein [Pedobacter sp.]
MNIKCSNEGFTLIEVLVAVTIFAIGLLALAGMQITAITGGATSQRVTAAVGLADGIVQNLMARDAGDPIFDTAVSPAVAWPETLAIEGFSATYAVAVNTPVNGISQITVTVTDDAFGGRSVSQTTMKRNR